MKAKPHPEQGFRACLGILRLARSYGVARLEAACRDNCSVLYHRVPRLFDALALATSCLVARSCAIRLPAAVPEVPLAWCGGLRWDLATADIEACCRQHSSWGYDIRRVDRPAAALIEPRLADPPALALHVAEEGAVEPRRAALALLVDAERRGARLAPRTSPPATASGASSTHRPPLRRWPSSSSTAPPAASTSRPLSRRVCPRSTREACA